MLDQLLLKARPLRLGRALVAKLFQALLGRF
jgi:hypothetical protein